MKKEIVQKAAYLFLQFGYKSVTMDDLAEQMRISKKTIYTYFDDKTSLIRASVWYIFDEVKTKIISVQESMDNPIEALYEIKKIAVEVQGAQHTKYVKFFHKNRFKYSDQLKRDEKKLDFCKANDIKLAEVYPQDEIAASLFKKQDIYL